MLRNVLLAVALLSTTVGCAEATSPKPQLQSGIYEGLILAVSTTGRITGSFRMEQGEGVTRTCAFTFSGEMTATEASVKIRGEPRDYSPVIQGRIVATNDGVDMYLPRANELPGCGMVIGGFVERGAALSSSLFRTGDWTDLAEVRAKRAYLRATPQAADGKAYVVEKDVVGVLAREGDSVKVAFPSEEREPTIGWVKTNELTSLDTKM